MATTSKTKSVSSLNKQLAGVASKAKSLGINTGKADAMVAQTTAQGSKSFKGSSYEKDYQASAIAADGLAPTAPINLPEKPTVPDVGNLVAPGNIGLQSTAEGMYTVDPATGMTTMAAPTDPLAQNQQGRLADMFAAYEGMGSGEADLAKLEKENKLAQKRQAVSNYTGQLNAIVAKSQAEQLGLEGQGRGITESIIGGQQAQINREAAIQALPVQAQLAAAQGDLEMAQAHVDKLFAIKRQDVQALFQFKSSVINSVYDFADKQEQRRLDEVSKQEDRKYSEQQDFLKTQRNLLSSALQQGAPASVVEAIGNSSSYLDALSAAGQYGGDILARQIQQAQLRNLNAKPVSTTSTEAPTVKSINGEDRQWNPTKGTWDAIGGGNTARTQQVVDSAQDKLNALMGIRTHKGLNSAVGPTSLGRVAIGDAFGAKQDFIGSVENILSTETLDTLVNLKAKGGTLGALSDQELKMLQESASKVGTWRLRDESGNVIGYNVDETRFKSEVGRLETLTQKAIKSALGYDPAFVPTQDSGIIDLYLGTGGAAFNPSSYY